MVVLAKFCNLQVKVIPSSVLLVRLSINNLLKSIFFCGRATCNNLPHKQFMCPNCMSYKLLVY